MNILANIQDLRDLRRQYHLNFEQVIDNLRGYLSSGNQIIIFEDFGQTPLYRSEVSFTNLNDFNDWLSNYFPDIE